MASIRGVRCISKDTYAVFYVEEFSDDLKSVIRSQLSSICHGVSKATKSRKRYNYLNTLKSFLERYESKNELIKIGMIGELLTRIIVIIYFPDFMTVSPSFNTEEKSMPKGFDIMLYFDEENELWFTEIKSGQLRDGKDSNETNRELLIAAKNELKEELNKNDVSLWDNAINKAKIALDRFTDTKLAVEDIIEDIMDETLENQSSSKDKNVIIATNLFADLDDEIQSSEIEQFCSYTSNQEIFNKFYVISTQKQTYIEIYNFLKDEIKQWKGEDEVSLLQD